MKTFAESALGRAARPRTVAGALSLALVLGIAACGRRGPPLAPLQVDPEAPQVLPLRQESGQVVVRWYAPRLDSGGDAADLRLRKAIVSFRVVDLLGLAAEERASQRRGPEEDDPDTASEAEEADLSEAEEPEPDTAEGAAADPGAPEASETPAGEDAPAPEPETGMTAGPETEEPLPGAAPSGEAPAAEQPPPAPAEEESTVGEPLPDEPEPEPEPEQAPTPEPDPGQATEPEQAPTPERDPEQTAEPEPAPETEPGETGEEPDTGESPEGAAGEDDPEQAPEPEAEPGAEPEAEPEPAGVLLDYEDLEFEVLSEIESEAPGEERVLELPVEPDWIGRRLEITVRYEARGGASEESEIRSLDVTGPLPAVEGVSVDVGPSELTVRWQDPRPALEGPLPLSGPVFEVFRRRGGESERLGRSFGPQQVDADVVWGEEVCYQARLVVAGSTEESVIPDPGPVPPDSAGADESVGEGAGADVSAGEAAAAEESLQEATAERSGEEATAAEAGGEEAPAPAEATEGDVLEPPAAESGDPQGETALPEGEPEPEAPPFDPIPIRVPGAGSGAASLGPMSAEACVTPVDVFPPLPPSDLRLFWQAQQTDLSWRESTSADVVGYHVYRTGPDGAGFQRLTESLVEQTSFVDAARDPRGGYRYAVTAVDGADPPNESLPSDPRRANPR